jgi:hypothetical protein
MHGNGMVVEGLGRGIDHLQWELVLINHAREVHSEERFQNSVTIGIVREH